MSTFVVSKFPKCLVLDRWRAILAEYSCLSSCCADS